MLPLLASAACLLQPMSPSTPRSVAIPLLQSPMIGDLGFDPLGLATADNLQRMREAEVRHGRLAMVAAWGWPVAEVGFAVAQRLLPVSSVCSGDGCGVDRTEAGRQAALQLSDIGLISACYWGTLLAAAVTGELQAPHRL
ncbi:hypothetical protein EMIHUDRAFT_236822 [Emiliania huxleyi CCMP1516]|uniref:Light harvesting protein n=2 Tax=Emiliania huxleyi TaxID=2903 RepID=A0A0D3JRV8_EMIH1|nr:hypothetical protein EMIHUDRAFT_236822 [Emiliania huxleyi CCMP1516]EOD26243.1 hypothetical protein EMIHUDRAFT_236822 [Emiliania huxleyi CCMP1516]|eukprot:XP_005778672.1 hypothetical protein EMIHUDRAFT_236822 [Emiliania huxleyi CCMP1516]